MPELPEVEHLRRTLEPTVVGSRVVDVRLHRPDVLRNSGLDRGRTGRRVLLLDGVVDKLIRRGKQLAVVSTSGPVVCVHLGMSGQLRFLPPGRRLPDSRHVHCVWRLASPDTGRPAGRLVFRDPRRFGGLWTFPTEDSLGRERWAALGPDALTLDARALQGRLLRTSRTIKAALLDQRLLAGLGNIYVDESLYHARLHPLSIASALSPAEVDTLAASIRSTLRQAIRAGGSTFRDYVDANGNPGRHRGAHAVYGRAGEPCPRCGRVLEKWQLAQRTTVACPCCQRRVTSPAPG